MFLLVAPCNLIHISGNLRGKAGWMWSLEVTLNCVIRNKPGIAYATHFFLLRKKSIADVKGSCILLIYFLSNVLYYDKMSSIHKVITYPIKTLNFL